MSVHPLSALPVEFGHAADADTRGTGWFLGYSDWSRLAPHDLRYMPRDAASTGLCCKWFQHPAGDPNGEGKPVSTGRTISLLVSEGGRFRIDFSLDPSFPPEATVVHTLQRVGDYAIWGPGLHHRWYALTDATIITVRWEPAAAA